MEEKRKVNKDALIQSLLHQLDQYKDYDKLKEQMLEYQRENQKLKSQLQALETHGKVAPEGPAGPFMFS